MISTNLYKEITKRENIYLAIYSLESYTKEIEELFTKDDYIKILQLKDKFNFEIINPIIEEVIILLEEKLLHGKFFDISVFLKPKKFEEEIIFRPIHSTDLITHIALVSILNVILFKFESNEKKFNDLSFQIPDNFYGNIPSIKPDELFKPWQEMYKKFSDDVAESYSLFCSNKKYKFEVTLDLKNFFPSINPYKIYQILLDLLKFKYEGEEFKALQQILLKLIYFNINNLPQTVYNKEYLNIPLNKNLKDFNFNKGIPQGLPHSFFLGNLCMLEISKIYSTYFKGKSFYYVDDSVIFTNDNYTDFKAKLEDINLKLLDLFKVTDNYKYLISPLKTQLIDFSKSMNYQVRIHTEEKSEFSELQYGKRGEQYLRYLTREASQSSFDVKRVFSDLEELSLGNKFSTLEESIQKEIDRIKNKDNHHYYKKLLTRFKKFFKFRRVLIEQKKKTDADQLRETILDKIKFIENNKINLTKVKSFFDAYNEDIFIIELKLLLQLSDQDNYILIKNSFEEVDKKLFGHNYKKFAFFSNIIEKYNMKNRIEKNSLNPYFSLLSLFKQKLPLIQNMHKENTIRIISNLIKDLECLNKMSFIKKYLNEDFLKCTYAINSSDDFIRKLLNAYFSHILNFELNDEYTLNKKNNSLIFYNEMRLLLFLRNPNFSFDSFLLFYQKIQENIFNTSIDYKIFEVLKVFRLYINKPSYIDNLILIHKYTAELWKNGSKFLHFYTLHNQEHGVDLIKNSISFLKAVDFLKISKIDYYILFISCYLHDISMVIHPDLMEAFNSDKLESNLIYTDFKNQLNELQKSKNIDYIDAEKVKQLILDFYLSLDSYFENFVRSKHANNSADFIRRSNDLGFLRSSIRELVASVSEAHGYDTLDIYHTKSIASKQLYSRKFMNIALRISDLLDISKQRINSNMLNNNIDYMSDTTRFHWLSHQIIERYEISTEYENMNNSKDESYLQKKIINEKIRFKIYVNISLACALNKKCKNAIFVEKNENSFVLKPKLKNNGVCTSESCNFLCYWLSTKNDYLYKELAALQEYLNTVDNYFTTSIEIIICFKETKQFTSKEFRIISDYLSNE